MKNKASGGIKMTHAPFTGTGPAVVALLGALPDAPSLKDAGYNAEYAQWSGLFIPRDTPEPVAQRLRAAAKAAAQDARVKEVILNAGSPVLYLDSPDFENMYRLIRGAWSRSSSASARSSKV